MFKRILLNPSAVVGLSQRFNSTATLKKTCLYDFHVKHGGKMVDFAGYAMPVQYADQGIVASHLHTRKHCSIFDVSHMLQSRVLGEDRIEFIENLTVADIEGLDLNSGTLSVFTNDDGGIIDDLIITKTDAGYLYVVTNAGCRDKDIPLMVNKAESMKKYNIYIINHSICFYLYFIIKGREKTFIWI